MSALRIATAALLFAGCWGPCSGCPGWEATPKAGFERMAASRLKWCVQNNPCTMLQSCFRQSEEFCVDAGYSPRCGQLEPEGSCGEALR